MKTVKNRLSIEKVCYLFAIVALGCANPSSSLQEHVAEPVILSMGGSVSTFDEIILQCETAGAKIVYTIDGSDPEANAESIINGISYTAPFTLPSGTTTLKVIAVKQDMASSTIKSASFSVLATFGVVENPTIVPSGGTIRASQTISLHTNTAGATIVYTTDGSLPVMTGGTIQNGLLYGNPLTLPSGTKILQAVAYKDGLTDSEMTTASFTVAAPVLSVTGYYLNGVSFPCYWENGTKIDLAAGSIGGQAYGSFLDNGDLYISGFDADGYDTACYWHNGIRTEIPNGTTDTSAFTVFVKDGTVHLAGTSGSQYRKATYYNGSSFTVLPGTETTGKSEVRGMIIVGSDVYITGWSRSNTGQNMFPCYWLNGIKYDLDTGNRLGYSSGITSAGGSIYISGYYFNGTMYVACYWKDGVRTDLSGTGGKDSYGNGIYVSPAGTVYVAGTYGGANKTDDKACYWKDGALVDLTGTKASALFVYELQGDVYCAGGNISSSTSRACYWKNGARTDLMGSGTKDTYMFSAVIK